MISNSPVLETLYEIFPCDHANDILEYATEPDFSDAELLARYPTMKFRDTKKSRLISVEKKDLNCLANE
ncbi:hypothetical protein AYI68_g4773 [Smittium mucronatum]|uniref:Uncharacterized protein n=1 Tax=Smittium mucronatum TaxID=133383 RepID=A0A1R0GW47_9FUNG|nr:hypothetical protein AYI68_g4773 [Smittium mucronatum]